jgi:putative tryptophan/tyrosine transport system substrate-binding protein
VYDERGLYFFNVDQQPFRNDGYTNIHRVVSAARVGDNPVRLGLVASLAHSDGNATGINFFSQEVVAKRLRLLHELVPKAVRFAVLVNPANAAVAENTVRDAQQAAPALGLQVQFYNASTIPEIDVAF